MSVVGNVSADFLWTSSNCPAGVGNVMDALCCGEDTFCRKKVSQSSCTSDVDDAALYCQWEEGKCQPVEDRKSNVCCRGQETNSCAQLFAGKCPAEFEVKKECCQGDAYTKFAFLETSDPENLICCNAPCKAMEAANCTLTSNPKCAPSARSFALHNPYHNLGFHHGHFDHRFGTIFHGTGYGYDYPFKRPYRYRRRGYGKKSHHKKHHKKHSKYDHDDYYEDDHHHDDHYEDDHHHDDHYDSHDEYGHDDYYEDEHVDEITVDDIFALMIDAMEKDTDVKIYDADISSDPYLGKNWSGGLFVDHHFPDFEPLIDEIYAKKAYQPYGPYYGPHEYDLKHPYGGYGGYGVHPYAYGGGHQAYGYGGHHGPLGVQPAYTHPGSLGATSTVPNQAPAAHYVPSLDQVNKSLEHVDYLLTTLGM